MSSSDYKDNSLWLMKGDCLERMKEIPDGSVDLIATDPPYEIHYCSWDGKVLNWNALFMEFSRVLKDEGNLIMFQGWSNVCETIAAGKGVFSLKNWIIYDRIKGRGAKTNLVSTREDILWFTKSESYTFNKVWSNIPKKTKGMGGKNGQPNRALSNVWTDISPIVPWSKEREDHPTQKPLSLMERIVNIYSNEGDTVLDPFSGSFTTGVAALRTGRKFIGIELDDTYFELGKARVLNEIGTATPLQTFKTEIILDMFTEKEVDE